MVEPVETNLIIDGRWSAAADERRYELHNPADPDELVGRAARGGPEDVDRAVRAAHRAFPAWSALSWQQRAEYLSKIAHAVGEASGDLAERVRLFCREHGKVLKEAGMEMSRLGDRFALCASYAGRLADEQRLAPPPLKTLVTRQPRGVAALIVPWNWPLSILAASLPQALLAGNTVVVKTAYESCLAPALTIRRIAEALPPGVVNLVTGSAAEAGEPLVAHPLVRKVVFTGSIEAGKRVMAAAAAGLKSVTLELGGNDPAIVLEDADLGEPAIQRMAAGALLTAGQVCMALKRLYVHRSRHDELVERLTAAVARQVVGSGLDPEVTMGPLNNERRLGHVEALVQDAQARGATVEQVGRIADERLFAKGYFHRPAIVTGGTQQLRVVREEQFGPLVPILPFDEEDEAIALANDTEHGLCSSVWTADGERAVRVARRIEAGYTYINAHGPMVQDSRAPFGGFKHSGVGRELGFEGVLDFLEPHSISSLPG